MSNQFDLNKFNSFLDKATQVISCDSDCQKEKTEQELKVKYLDAQSNLSLAEPEFQVAKQNYYTYTSGVSGYNEIIENEFKKSANLIVANFKKKYQDEITKIKSQLETYNGLLINFRNIIELDEKYKKENNELYKKLKKNTNDILTNERKTYYEDQEIESLNSYYYYILWVIYVIVIICFIIFSLIYPSQGKLGLVILFIILPFISTWILGKIIFIIYWLFGLLPKNIYK